MRVRNARHPTITGSPWGFKSAVNTPASGWLAEDWAIRNARPLCGVGWLDDRQVRHSLPARAAGRCAIFLLPCRPPDDGCPAPLTMGVRLPSGSPIGSTMIMHRVTALLNNSQDPFNLSTVFRIPNTQGSAASPWGSRHPHFIVWLKVGELRRTVVAKRCTAGRSIGASLIACTHRRPKGGAG
jgi:hypothetical protein